MQDTTYLTQRDTALRLILNMTDELLRLDAEVQALQAENKSLEAATMIFSTNEEIGMDVIERKVFELGCEQLLDKCFYTWNKVVQSSDTDEKAPCSFEQWRRGAFRSMYQPDWISTEQLYDVLDPMLRKLYAEHVEEFMKEDESE